MPKIKIEKIIRSDRSKVYDIITNYENFKKKFPKHFPSVLIRSERDNVSVIEEHIVFGKKEFVMMTKHVKKPPDLHEIFVIGGDGKGSHIIEKYESIPEGTKLTVEADLKFGGFLKHFQKNNLADGLEDIINEFARISES